ncbi:MAG: aldose 1-epimerase family protein [Oscillospiraceae bacterium]|nr:aldose 1-epimerase family protein [Oscillospiraceae bacterium]
MIYTIQNGYLTAQVKTKGAELCSLKDGQGTEFLFDANPAYWGRSAPVLFPFVGSLKNKAFSYGGRSYPMGQHGFARDMEFTLLEQGKQEIWFRLLSDEETLQKYPFSFVLDIGYRLEGNEVRVSWKVHNPDREKTLYFSIGAHPAFLCPPAGGGMDGCYLGFDLPGDLSYRLLNAQGLVTGESHTLPLKGGCYPLSPGLFDHDALLVEGRQTGRVWLADREKKPFVTVAFDAPLFGVWSPAGKDAPFVCIEPWYGRCDGENFSGDLTKREYGNNVAPGETFRAAYQIIIG